MLSALRAFYINYCNVTGHAERPASHAEFVRQWRKVLDTPIQKTCDCIDSVDAPWPHYCLWCFRAQGCGRNDCGFLVQCEHPQCFAHQRYSFNKTPLQNTSICRSCLKEHGAHGWKLCFNSEAKGMLSLCCPWHQVRPHDNISITMFESKRQHKRRRIQKKILNL